MSENNKHNFQKLVEIITTLRSEQGCPWDRKQTPVSMKPYLLEETHELTEAIDESAPREIKEEIGDLFFQLTLIARMYQEEGEFTIEDCLGGIIEKMIRRHPHVFQAKNYYSTKELKADWQKIKESEKKDSTSKTGNLDLPKSLPALNRAQRVIHRSSARESENRDLNSLTSSLNDRMSSLTTAILQEEKDDIADNLGWLLLELMQVGHIFDIYCEDLLKNTTDEFIDQKLNS
ncbi:MAG: MazG family protein [Desulfurivibrionaceae bacterium]